MINFVYLTWNFPCTQLILVNKKHSLYILYIDCTNWLKAISCQEQIVRLLVVIHYENIHELVCFRFLKLNLEKSAKLHTLLALLPYVPRVLSCHLCFTCSHAVCPPQLYEPHALHALIPYVPCALLALVPYMLRDLRASCPTSSRAPRDLCQMCSHVLHDPELHVPRALYGVVPRALGAIFPYVTYCLVLCVLYVQISPFAFLSFHALHSYFSVQLLLWFFVGNLPKLKQI